MRYILDERSKMEGDHGDAMHPAHNPAVNLLQEDGGFGPSRLGDIRRLEVKMKAIIQKDGEERKQESLQIQSMLRAIESGSLNIDKVEAVSVDCRQDHLRSTPDLTIDLLGRGTVATAITTDRKPYECCASVDRSRTEYGAGKSIDNSRYAITSLFSIEFPPSASSNADHPACTQPRIKLYASDTSSYHQHTANLVRCTCTAATYIRRSGHRLTTTRPEG